VLTDFGIATRVSQEPPQQTSLEGAPGTPAYMSPEQTGRMNRALDYRTDLYSLGVTLYELLSGGLPFPTTDPMELAHSHIARVPMRLHDRAPAVPEAVSAVVAIAAAQEQRFTHHEALANELAARFYLAQGREKIGRAYLVDAHHGYLLWGAMAKAEDLVRQHPELLGAMPDAVLAARSQRPLSQQAPLPGATTTASSTTTATPKSAEGLDFAAVIRVGQAIAGELVLDRLLSRVTPAWPRR
jgi:serine/threonine protein kinase